MRHLGNVPSETQARVFGDLLLAQGIRSQVEHDGSDGWSIWILDEDQVADAQQWLERFRANPDAAEFSKATADAAKVRSEQAADLARYRERLRTRQSLFPKLGGYGVGVLTYALIFICVAVGIYSMLGANEEVLRPWFISYPETGGSGFLPEVRAGEVWRLVTPMFIHFGVLHILFNMMWLYQLGCMIEGRLGTGTLAALVVASEALSALAQYFISGPFFGGMSGVVYALAGYVWMRGKYDRASGVGLDSRSLQWLLIWLVICFTPLIGHVANTSHVVGLAGGVVWGRAAAFFASRRPES